MPDESILELKKIHQLQQSYGPSIFLLEQDQLKIEMNDQHELGSNAKRKSDLPEIHTSQGKAVLQSA